MSQKNSFSQLKCFAFLCFASLTILLSDSICAQAESPVNPHVISGNVKVEVGQNTVVNQNSPKAIVNWDSFNVGAGSTVTFNQPDRGVILNRINSANGPSEILGKISANGTIVLVNQAGIMFGKNAVVDVANLIASTRDIEDKSFLLGKYNFNIPGLSSARIINQGKLKAANGGLVALVGNNVTHTGEIIAQSGRILIGNKSHAVLDTYGDALINLVYDGALDTQPTNVIVTSADIEQVLKNTLNLDGYDDGGTIILSGRADVSANDNRGRCGNVYINGDTVNLDKKNVINALGMDGGRLIIKADKNLNSEGVLNASGIHKGGFIELSTNGGLTYENGSYLTEGKDNASTGSLLLDPRFLIIQTSSGSGYSAGVNNMFTNNATGTTIITPASIVSAAISANIVLQSNTDITFNDALAITTAGRSLTVQAGRSIFVNANISTIDGPISMTANDTSALAVDRNLGAANITMANGASINSGTAALSLEVMASTTSPYSPGSMALFGLTGGAVSISANNGLLASGNIVANSSLSVDIASDTDGTISGAVSGTGTFNKLGLGILTLSGANTFTGSRTVSAGTLIIAHNTGLGSSGGSVSVLDGSTLLFSNVVVADQDLSTNGEGVNSEGAVQAVGNCSLGGNIDLATTTYFGGTGTLVYTGFNGVISGSSTANLVKVGTGIFTIQDASNTYNGQTIIREGTIEAFNLGNINANSSLGSPATAQATILLGTSTTAATLSFIATANDATNRPIVIGAAGAEMKVNNATSSVFLQGQISGGSLSSVLRKTGPGLLDFDSVVKTYTGTTRVEEGTLKIDLNSAIPSTTDLIIQSGAIFQLENHNQIVASISGAGTIDHTSGTDTLTFGDNTDTEFSGVIMSSGGVLNIVKQGSGVTTLSGSNSYNGTTVVSAGTLKITNADALGTSGSGTTVNDNATLYLEGTTISAEPLIINGTGTNSNGALFSSGISEWGGPLSLNNNSAIGNTETLKVSGAISGAFALQKLNSGTLILSGTNSYSGATTISAGVLQIASDSGLGAVPGVATAEHIILDGGSLNAAATFTLAANRGIDLRSSSSAIQVESGFSLTYDGIIDGNSSLNKSGLGILILGGNNTYTGATNINQGSITASAVDIIAQSSALFLSDVSGVSFNLNNNNQSIKNLSGGGTVGGNIDLGTGVLTVIQTTDGIYAGAIFGAGSFTMGATSTNTLSLTGTASTFSGATTLNGGILSISSDSALGTAPGFATAGHLVFGGGRLNAIDNFVLNSNRGILLSAGGGTLSANSGAMLTYNGIMTGSNSFDVSGNGKVILGGSNTYSGVTHVLSGILSLTNVDSLGASSLITVSDGGTLDFNFGTGTLSNTSNYIINGAGSNNQGALSFSGENTTLNNTVTIASNTTIRSGNGGAVNFAGIVIGNFNLTFLGNNVTGNVDVDSLSLGTNFCDLYGLVDGVGGQSAIDKIAILNPPLIINTHFFDGIDFGGINPSNGGDNVENNVAISAQEVNIISDYLYITLNDEKDIERKPFTPDVYKIFRDGDFRLEYRRRGNCIQFGENIELCSR